MGLWSQSSVEGFIHFEDSIENFKGKFGTSHIADAMSRVFTTSQLEREGNSQKSP
jgi:hypothetical protein